MINVETIFFVTINADLSQNLLCCHLRSIGAKSILSRFTHFCVEKNLFRNCACGEKRTNIRYDAVLASLTQGGKLPQIANMLSDFTGRKFTRNDVYSLVKRLQKPFLVIDTDTGEEKVEFRGVQVAAQGLGLSQSQSRKGQESKLEYERFQISTDTTTGMM